MTRLTLALLVLALVGCKAQAVCELTDGSRVEIVYMPYNRSTTVETMDGARIPMERVRECRYL
jgi:hypothetical protein